MIPRKRFPWLPYAIVGGFVSAFIGLICLALGFVFNVRHEVDTSDLGRQDANAMIELSEILRSKDAPEVKIRKAEPILGQLRSPANAAQEKRQVATLYEHVGNSGIHVGDPGSFQKAETAFKRANELDPENPKLMSDLAALYGRYATTQSKIEDRVALYDESIRCWQNAAEDSGGNQQEHDKYLVEAGQVFLAKGSELWSAGRIEDSSEAVREGMANAPLNATIYRDLSDFDSKIKSHS